MASKKENKSLAWPSSILGCLPSSKNPASHTAAKPKMSISRHPHESDDDEHAPDDTIIGDPQMLEKLSQQIDNFLYHAGGQGNWSESLGTIATGINISSRGIDSMSRGFSGAYEKIKSTKFEDVMTTAGEILAVMGKVHWAASGLLVVAAVIHNIEKQQRVNKECIELLTLVNIVAKSLRKLTKSAHVPEEMETTINQATDTISTSVACCFSIIESNGFCKCIMSSKNANEIFKCKKELKNMQQALVYQLVIADFTERHESLDRPLHKTKKQEGQFIYKPEEEKGSELSTAILPRGIIGKYLEKLNLCSQAGSSDTAYQDSAIDESRKPDEVISNLLNHLQTEDERAVAVFLYGERQTGLKTVAKEVWRKQEGELKKEWNLIEIEAERGQGGLAEEDGLVFDLRANIIKQLEEKVKASKPEKGSSLSEKNLEERGKSSKSEKESSQRGNKLEPQIEKDKDWDRNLRDHLKAARRVFIFIPKVPSAGILKRILPRSIAEGVKIRILLLINDKSAFSALEGSMYKTRLYIMKPLRYREALGVFRENFVLDKSRELVVRKIIKICKGYRKRMETVRKYLSNYYIADDEAFKRLSEWIEAKEPNFTELMGYLTSEEIFLHLSPIAQDALLDICSFFNNWGWHETACILDSDVLEKLRESELVKRESNKVSVPLTVMTYCLSRAKGIRITRATDLHDVMLAQKDEPGKFSFLQGIWMSENKFPFHIDSSQLDKMENLRVLALGDWTIVTGDCNKEFRHLRYFQAGKLERLPFKIDKADNLRFFENNSHHYFGSGSKEVPPNLRLVRSKGMKLEQYLDFSSMPEGCELTDLSLEGVDQENLPETLCDVYFLQNIYLSQCKKLKKLPKSFGKLQCLKTLDLSHCEALYELSPNFGWLICLEKANFSYCRELKCLPDSIGLLRSVKELDFSYCKSLEELPKSFVKLATLQVLNLRGCSHLLELPEGFDGLALKELYFESCKRLKALHEKVGAAESLTQIKVSLSWCKSLTELSKGFISVIKVQVVELILVDCVSLQMLPENFSTELSNLKTLNLSGCKSLSRLPKRLSKLKYLQSLNLESCERLEESSIKLSHLSSLQELNLSNCHGLAGDCLGSLITIKSLTYLDIHGSPMLVDRWNLLNRDRRICHLVVNTSRPGLGSLPFSKSLKEDPHIRKELKRGIYEFFNGKWIFLDLDGRQFHPSSLQEGSTLAVLFYQNYQETELKALGKILDDIQATCEKLQIVHVGTCVTQLEKKLAGNHVVYSSDNYGALVFFEKALCTVEGFDQSMSYAIIISDVVSRDKHKNFASWTGVTYQSVREMTKVMDFQTVDYLHLKDLIEDENPQEQSNIKLLEELLLTKEIKFLISKTRQVQIQELRKKCVFLLFSWLHNMETDYKAFNNVYQRLQILLNIEFEVVWIPIVIQGRGTRAVHAKWVENVEWLSIADPWSINPMLMRYFRRHTSFDKLPLLAAVSPNGRFYFDNFVLNTKIQEEKLNMLVITEDRKRITELVQSKVKEVLMKLTEESKLVEEIDGKEREQQEEINVRKERTWKTEMERKIREQLRKGSQWRDEMEIKIRDEVLMNLIEENKLREKTKRKGKEKVKDKEKKKVKDKERKKVESQMWEEMKQKIKQSVTKEIEIKIKESVIKEGDKVVTKLREEVERKFRKELESKDIEEMFNFQDELVARKIEWWWTKEVNKKINKEVKKEVNKKNKMVVEKVVKNKD